MDLTYVRYVKVRGPFVQTLCIEKRLIYGRHLTCKYIEMMFCIIPK